MGERLNAIEFVARMVALIAITVVSLWCVYGYGMAVIAELGWRPQVGWGLGFLASRMAFHSVAFGGLRVSRAGERDG